MSLWLKTLRNHIRVQFNLQPLPMAYNQIGEPLFWTCWERPIKEAYPRWICRFLRISK